MTTLDTDVLVIGSGPAGAAAACTLAGLGHRVALMDRRRFARDKVCGDALIPDALRALARLGLKDRVVAEALAFDALRIHAPNGASVRLASEIACLPRQRLDDILRTAAIERGARFLAPYRLTRALEDGGAVTGAVFDCAETHAELRVEARFTLLATGAASRPLELFGVCERRSASAMAARIYLQVSDDVARRYRELAVSYDREICPGYGWIFPGPHGVFNVGVGYFDDDDCVPPTRNLRELLARFVGKFAPAKELVAHARQVTDVRGAPLRTALSGSRLSRPGLLVIGEAAGLTYSFSGEGIGKAMESGIVAGELVAEALSNPHCDVSQAAARYASTIVGAFAERFGAYRRAQRWLARPAIADFVAWRANSNDHIRRQLEALLAETEDPRVLFSVSGLMKALVG